MIRSFKSSALIKPFCILANPQGSILSYRRVVFSPIIWNFQENIVSLQQELKEMSPVFRRESEYTFKIFSNEEERMHIHVIHKGHEAKY